MSVLLEEVKQLKLSIDEATKAIGLSEKQAELQQLEQKVADPELWSDQKNAETLTKQKSYLESFVGLWQKLSVDVSDLYSMATLQDVSLQDELDYEYQRILHIFTKAQKSLLYDGPYDQKDVIVSIYAGAGGTDAQDWADMLKKMYIKFAEIQQMKTVIIDESSGEEAGIKSVTMEISGPLAYGKLQSEHGVHRLVRLSPFNADNLRQTSFAKVDVLPKINEPNEVEVDEKDLKIDVYRSGGKGGQSVNTTDSAVRITHIPTGIVVAIQNERSQLQNKETAMTILRSKLAQLLAEQHKEAINDLKGPNEQVAWGNQIRNYVLHPYSMVKDVRTKAETSDVQSVFAGNLDLFIEKYLDYKVSSKNH